jgi:peptidoglycan/LPS O-acetylase OafA/YrhL
MHYKKEIQGLRALAILFVFIYHLNSHWLPGGFIGVDVFFVLSGFLMATIVLKQQEDGTFSFTEFYAKRIKRIVPAYYIMVLVTALASAFILIGNDGFTRELKHVVGFNANYCYATMNSYFGRQAQQTPLLHTWSIAVEMKFYLLLPIVLFFIKRKFVPFAVGAIAMLLLGYSIYQTVWVHDRGTAYYSVIARVPEFCIGILVALLPLRLSGQKGVFGGIIGLTTLLCCAIFYNAHTPFPGYMVLIPCLGTTLLLISVSGPVNRLLSSVVFEKTGNLSYSIYLWHWPVMALIRYYYGLTYFSISQLFFITFLTVVLAWCSYTFVEEPFRKMTIKRFTLSISPFIFAIVALYVFFPSFNERFINIPKEYREPVFGMKSHNANFVETFGDTLVQPEVLLIGNSHALSMKPYMDYIGKKYHFSFRTITSNSYLAISGINGKPDRNVRRYSDFESSQKQVALTEREIKKAKIIIMVMSSWDMLPSQMPATEKLVANLRDEQRLVFITPFPVMDKNPIEVNRGFIKCKDRKQNYRVTLREQNPELEKLINKYHNVHFIDFQKNTVFKSIPFYNDTIMYYDARHMNRFGALKLARHTEKQFMQVFDSLK